MTVSSRRCAPPVRYEGSRRTSAARARWAAWLVGLLAVLLANGALADDRTAFLIEHLKYPPPSGVSDDFRVRLRAALALGETNNDVAVGPLCQALGDPNDTVRSSVAAALKRLARPSSLGCLKSRLSSESVASVQLQIRRAVESIESSGGGGGEGGGGGAVANAKFYVALSPVSNNTGRAQADVERVVLGAIRSKLGALGSYQLAPDSESPDAARAEIAKRKLKAYFLSILVEKFDYSDGNLRVRVKVAVFTYPGKDLRGEVPAGLTQQGVRPGDKSAEENLMSMAAGRAAELFAQNFQ